MKTKMKCFCLFLTVCLAVGLLPGVALGASGNEARCSTDGGQTWTECSLIDAIWACYGAADGRIELLRDVLLTGENWTSGQVLAYENCSLTIDGKGKTLKRGQGVSLLGSVNMPGSVVTLKNVTVDGGAVWSGDDPATRTNTGLSFGGNAHLFTVYGDSNYCDDASQGGTLILDAGTVLQNSHLTGNQYGAAINVGHENSGTLIMRDGAEIKDNAVFSGTVYVWGGGSFMMEGGKISGNYGANNGGAVCVESGEMMMSGGEISGNKAKSGGGGVSVFNPGAQFTMTGGSIKENGIEGQKGGGVLVHKGSMTVSGTPVITGNTGEGGKPNNTYLPRGKTITIDGALSAGASIGVTTEVEPTVQAPVTIVQNTDNLTYHQYFQADGSYDFVMDDNNVIQFGDHVHIYGENDWKSDETDHWQACAACGNETEHVAHTMTAEEKCSVCGYTKPVTPPQTEVVDIPLTGDSNHLALWVSMLLLSGAGFVGLMVCKRKGLFKR